MSTVTEFSDALAGVITDGTDLTRVHVITADAAPVFPCAFLMPPLVDYDGLGDDGDNIVIQVNVFVSAVLGQGHEQLLAYQSATGPDSIRALIQDNRTLGLPDVDCHVVRARPLSLTEIAAYNAYGAAFELHALITPDYS